MAMTVVRVLSYTLLGVFTLAGAWLADWGVAYDALAGRMGTITIDVETAITMLVASVTGALAIFKKWGKW